MKKIPFHIVSGFLGSGKTTFLKRVIEQHSLHSKIGIIQNEFAPSNVDGAELKLSGYDFSLLEINNGSVFCVCLLGDFLRSLEKFIDQFQPDIVIIEASGLSDTTSIAEIISTGTLSQKIFLASNWCIVDARNFTKVGLMKQRVLHQLRMADVVIINKIDLIENGLDKIMEQIKELNPFAEIVKSTYCNIKFGLGNPAIDKFYFQEVKAMPRPDVNSMVIKSGRKISLKALEDFLALWASKAYRIKGFVNLKDGKMVAVQCTFDSVEIKEVKSDFSPTEIVALTDQFTLRDWNKNFREMCQS